jgi:hypothetical protein
LFRSFRIPRITLILGGQDSSNYPIQLIIFIYYSSFITKVRNILVLEPRSSNYPTQFIIFIYCSSFVTEVHNILGVRFGSLQDGGVGFSGRFSRQDGSLTGCPNLICISLTKLFQSVRFVKIPLISLSSNQVRVSPSI